jgi:PAS domain S-box-containing protein
MSRKKIQHTELTFQLIVESSPNAIILVNREGKIAYINNQTEKLFGYVRTEVIGQPVEMLIPERYRKKHPGFRNTFFSSPSVRAMGAGRELFAIRKDKTEFPVEIGLNPIVTVDGTLVLASIIDITERKKAEERFQLVVESAPNAMVLVNQDGLITLVNRQTEILFGYQRKELIGQKLEMLIPPRFRKIHPEHRKGFYKSLQSRPMGSGRDLFGLRKDGTEVQVEIGLNPIDTEEGQMVLASIINITERKVREGFERRQVELESRNKELEQFAYIASHDLQEPLRTVYNYIEVFEEDYAHQIDETALGYLQSVKKATKRMQSLVRGLLHYSRLGRTRKLTKTNFKKIIDHITQDLKSMITTSQASIDVGPLPVLNVYETEMRQLFQNLVGNAIKYKRARVNPKIRIRAHKTDEKWEFSVRDNGIGIDPAYHKRIFDVFQRLHNSRQYEGNGIGLASCKKIVELHQGEIWVESELGKGTTFYFTIPELTK